MHLSEETKNLEKVFLHCIRSCENCLLIECKIRNSSLKSKIEFPSIVPRASQVLQPVFYQFSLSIHFSIFFLIFRVCTKKGKNNKQHTIKNRLRIIKQKQPAIIHRVQQWKTINREKKQRETTNKIKIKRKREFLKKIIIKKIQPIFFSFLMCVLFQVSLNWGTKTNHQKNNTNNINLLTHNNNNQRSIAGPWIDRKVLRDSRKASWKFEFLK